MRDSRQTSAGDTEPEETRECVGSGALDDPKGAGPALTGKAATQERILVAATELREQVELYQSFVARHRTDVDGFLRWALEHTSFRDWLIRTLLDLHHRFGGALTETIAEIVPPHHDPHALAMGILVMLDGGLLISYFDDSTRTAEMRQLSIQAILDLIPRRSSERVETA